MPFRGISFNILVHSNAASSMNIIISFLNRNQKMKLTRYIFLISFVTVLMACGGAEERKAAYLDKAEKSLIAGDLDKARIELKNVLQIDPKDARAYFKLGNILERKQDFRVAFGNYNKAAELDPDNSEYQAKLGRFYLVLAGDIEKAEEKMDLILAKDANDINGLMLKTGILLKQDKPEEAKAIAKSLFDSHPENAENAIFLSTIYGRDKEFNEAIQVLDQAVKLNPDDTSLQMTLANTLFANKEFSRSEQILKGILSAHPDVFQNHMTLALFYQKTSESEKAEAVLRSAIAADTSDVKRKLVLIEYLQQTKGNEVAISELEGFIKNNLKESALRLALARLQLAMNNVDAAIATFKTAAADFSDEETGITSRVNLAKIYMQRNDVKKATLYIDEAAAIAPNDSEVNIVKAKMAIYNNNMEQAIISLRTVIKNTPDNIEPYFLLAGAHKSLNEQEQAAEVIVRAYENNRGNIKAVLPLARYHLSNNNVAEASRITDDYLSIDKTNYDMLSIKAGILNGGKNYKDASKIADELLSLHPNKDQGYIQSVPYLLSQNKLEDVIELLKTGHEKTASLDLFKMLAEVQIRSGKVDDAIAGLDKELTKNNDEALYLLLANAYMVNKDQEKTMQVLMDSIGQGENRDKSYLALAKLHMQNGSNDKAISLLKEGISVDGVHLELGLLLAGIYEKDNNFDDAIAQYKLMLDKSPDNLFVNNNLAALLSEHKTDTESLKLAKELADKIKNASQPVIKDTVGWVYYKTGNYQEAADLLKQVVDATPDAPVFNYHLGMAYYKIDNKKDAKIHLQKSLSSGEKFTGIDDARNTLKMLK